MTSAACLAGGLALGVPAAGASVQSASSGGAPSNVCSAVGAPSTTQTFGAEPVFHLTVFTCGDATATGFQTCPNKTIAVPDVLHATLFYCVPLQLTFGPAGDTAGVSVAGVGGISVGTG